MVSTGLQNNLLFPGLVASLLVIILSALYNVVFVDHSSSGGGGIGQVMLSSVAVLPLLVALWGSSLFKPGNTGMGFAATSNKNK